MKQQPCASKMSLSKILRVLLTVLGLKLFVLCFMLFESGLPSIFSSSAKAADSLAVGAPPAPAVTGKEGADGNINKQAGLTPLSQAGGAMPLSQMEAETEQARLPSVSDTAPVSQPGLQRTLPAIMPKRQTASDSSASAVSADPSSVASSSSGAKDQLARDALAKRQEDLGRKEQDLRALETDIAAKIEEMQLLESRMQSMMKQANDADDAKFRHLVDVLSNMKGKQAAAVLATLDEKIAVRVLAGMRGRQAGEILTYVPPQKAARLTEALVRMQMPYE